MKNTLLDLVSEYTEAASRLTDMIAHGNELLHQARQECDGDRVRFLEYRQRDLYAQRAHVALLAAQLRIYYAHSSETGIQ